MIKKVTCRIKVCSSEEETMSRECASVCVVCVNQKQRSWITRDNKKRDQQVFAWTCDDSPQGAKT